MAICGIRLRPQKRMKRRKNTSVEDNNNNVGHEGVKTVEADNVCEFSGSSDLCLCIVTWNMNGQVEYEDLKEIIGKKRKYELLVIGLQEVPRHNISQLLRSAVLQTHILLGKAIMQSLQLYIFGPKNSDLFIKEIKVDKHGVGGCGGIIRRKKGAVAIRVIYKDISMLFVSCHLSAHAHNVEERNSQCRHISNSLFSKNKRPAQLTVWLGDLNYRLQGIDSYPARDLIHTNLHSMLTSKDQLLQEADRGQIFDGYYEGTLAFKPTYKYDTGTSNYDTSHKVRAPAWTDRILYKVEEEGMISASLHGYDSMDSIHSSDHKPVKAHLCLKIHS